MSKKVLIIYAGKTDDGSTSTLANYISNGVKDVSGVTFMIKKASEANKSDVLNSDALICGSGDYNGNPEPDMVNFFDTELGGGLSSDMDKIKTMPFGVFATSAGYSTGVQEVLNSMARSLMTFGAIYVGGGDWHTSQGIAGMTEKNSSGGWQWANEDTTQKYLKEDACSYGRRIALASLAIPDNMVELGKQNVSTCEKYTNPSNNSSLSKDAKINIGLAVGAFVLLQIMLMFWYKQGLGKIGLSVDILLIITAVITAAVSRKSAIEQRRNVAIVMLSLGVIMLITSSIYGTKHKNIVPVGVSPGTPKKISRVVVVSAILIILISGTILLTTIESSSKGSGPGTGPGPVPDPKPVPQPKLACSSPQDCPNSDLFSCDNGTCVLKKSKLKNSIINYLDSLYPSSPKLSTMLKTDVELYNFFINLGYYWLSFNQPDSKDILTTTDGFPSNVMCGGYYVVPSSDDITVCGSKPTYSTASSWPTANPPCCKRGSLSIPPDVGQLYFCDYLTKSTGVLRNGYDMKNTLVNSVLLDPVYLYKNATLTSKNAMQNLSIIKDGVDGTGKKLSYKVCEGSKPYDFTVSGPGFASNSLAGCVRNKGTSGHATDTFYYIAQGTGNRLNLGVTARTLNKVHGTLLMIQRAGQLNFGSLTTYKMNKINDYFTITKQIVNLEDKNLTNSFVQAPQLLLLECLDRQGANIAFQNPTSQTGFGVTAAKALAPNSNWPFNYIAPQSSPQQSFKD